MISKVLLPVAIVITILYLLWIRSQEGFQDYVQIRDFNNILPDADGNNLAIIKNVKYYKNIELKDKVVKGLVFNKSEMQLTNLAEIRSYTLLFNIEFLNTQDNQIIICSLDNNDRIIYYLYIHNNRFYVKYKTQTIKFNTRITVKNLYTIVLGFNDTSLNIYMDGEKRELKNTKIYDHKNNIIFGGLKRSNKLLNPIHALIGNINIYRGVIAPEKIVGTGDICAFIPGGQSKAKCINACPCGKAYCEKICNECIDYTKCKWVKKPVKEPVGNIPDPIEPSPPKIKCYAGDSKIELRFKKPHDGNSPINSFLVIVKKSYKNDGFVKLATIDISSCGKNSCHYELHGLDNQEFYDVMVRSINSVGMSRFSNVETLAPDGEMASKQISSALVETDEEIKKKVMTDFNYDGSNCEAKQFINYDEHILDTTDKYSIDDIIREEYLKHKDAPPPAVPAPAATTVAPTAAPSVADMVAMLSGYIPEYSNALNFTKAWNARTPASV